MPSNANNRLLQQVLQAEGLYKGKIDGIIGPATRRALELHDKAQSQPLPRERPGPPDPLQGSVATGIPLPGATATMQLQPAGGEEALDAGPDREAGEAMPPMPNSMAEINSPFPATAGLPNPASGEWVRAALGAVLGGDRVPESPLVRMRSNLPDVASEPPPAYTPNFAGAAPPEPLDQGDLRKFMTALPIVTARSLHPGQPSLGEMLAKAVNAARPMQ